MSYIFHVFVVLFCVLFQTIHTFNYECRKRIVENHVACHYVANCAFCTLAYHFINKFDQQNYGKLNQTEKNVNVFKKNACHTFHKKVSITTRTEKTGLEIE